MRFNMKKKLLSSSVIPILVLGITVITLTMTVVRNSMLNETKDALKGTAIATLAAYDQNSGDYLQATNGDIWKGSYNISKSDDLVDNIKTNSGMDVTFFYGSKRVMTSAFDNKGNRILGSPMGETIIHNVLEKGQAYFTQGTSIDGVLNYGYYIPVYQKNNTDKPIGAVFVGTNKDKKDQAMNRILAITCSCVIIAMIICIIIATLVARSINKALTKNIKYVQEVSKGNLNIEVDKKIANRKDELGSLAQAVYTLKESLQAMLMQISKNTVNLTETSHILKDNTEGTANVLDQMQEEIQVITEGATSQASSVEEAVTHMTNMGEIITDAKQEVEALTQNSEIMEEASNHVTQAIDDLGSSMRKVQEAVEDISRQTTQTNESAQQIQQVTSLIGEIAEETNLLALNASIEAARAGEAGRGFAVVAQQIQKLAEQTNSASGTITTITATLMKDAKDTVQTMESVNDIVNNQNNNMGKTEQAIADVQLGIKDSVSRINSIDEKTRYLQQSRVALSDIVSSLASIAQENAASTEETSSQAMEMQSSFEETNRMAKRVKEVADDLEESVKIFKF